MGFSFSKFIGKNENKSTDTIEAIINDIEYTPFGISENNVLFAGLNELGGYYFFQSIVVGPFKIKTMNGASIIFKGENIELELKSDTNEFESDSTPIKGRNITKIDFQIEESDIETLKSNRVTSIQLKAKKQEVLFMKYVDKTDEEE